MLKRAIAILLFAVPVGWLLGRAWSGKLGRGAFGMFAAMYFLGAGSMSGGLVDQINDENFRLAQKDFSDRHGGIPYISGGRELVHKGTARSMTDADIGVLAIYLLEKGAVDEREFFGGLLSGDILVRCAACYAMEHKYGKGEALPPFRYADDPLGDDNWKSIEFWRKSMTESKAE